MALDLYMLGLVVSDMHAALTFYRRLGLDIPEGSERRTHVQIRMTNGLTFFLDVRPSVWDPEFVSPGDPDLSPASYRSILEFYLKTPAAVDQKYAEMTAYGYRSQRRPYDTAYGMRFAMILDPDGNTILLSGDLEPKPPSNG